MFTCRISLRGLTIHLFAIGQGLAAKFDFRTFTEIGLGLKIRVHLG